ncbi:efflux RND transporter permease subunit [Thalassotalea litorea]|uniref:Efflux RND transporter permease subunit n=1 Tax=Thalassotalea litorea TaxID=2020715 RepID=A0A5R9IZ22_9GAMM|nr:efflux RND transporter permease subunit [Thalassotalea litorea]TLU67168.1 efflux RND transporter permease subunit [Thalassotalea litorea]
MDDTNKGLIAWFARNPVAANLLMAVIIIGGLLTMGTIRKQIFPQIEINWLRYQAAYPGAAPQEVEEGITIKVEEALESVPGLERTITYSGRNLSNGWFRVDDNYDAQVVLEEVKSQIDSISTFPAGMERPTVERIKMEQEVLNISLYGDLTQIQLKELGRKIHDEIRQLPLVNITEFNSGLNYEIAIEVSKDKLRAYNLSFTDVANAVRNWSRNMSAGQIRAENGYINLRVENQAYVGQEFENLPLITREDGSKILLGDLATVTDGFEQGIQYSRFNGKNAVSFEVKAAHDQSITDIADVVNNYIAAKQNTLPAGVNLESWVDLTEYLEERLDMMISNLASGAILVFLMLALFLRIRLAFWVMMGLPVCFLGTLLFMPMSFINVTISLTSLFAFIMVLGIVVDDAIVMGESAHSEVEQSGNSIESVIRGVKRVAMPATFGVLTTIAAFMPFVIADGPQAAWGQAIGMVVVLCLIFSLIESKLILPSHLATMKTKVHNPRNPFDVLRLKIDTGLKNFIAKVYRPMLVKTVEYRYALVCLFIALIMVCVGLFSGGLVRSTGMPKVPHDFPRVNLEMNLDSSEQATLDAARAIEKSLHEVDRQLELEHGSKMIDVMLVYLRDRTRAGITVKLVRPEDRPLTTFEVAERWRANLPVIPGVKKLEIQDTLFGSDMDDGDISFRLESQDDQQLLGASKALKDKLNTLVGVSDVNDSRMDSAKEVQFDLKPLAYSLGLTLADVAQQVGYSFYGLEAQRILRNGEEIKVMVRYPLEQRSSIGHVDDVMVKAPNGAEVPLSEIADIRIVDGVNQIRRENGNRTINVWAKVDSFQAEPFEIAKDIRENFIPELRKIYPGLKSELGGQIQEEIDSQRSLMRDAGITLLIIFSLLAIPLRSYSQPIIIMSVIPFGFIGAVIGHMIHGLDLSSFSFFGLIAAAGVVVNDSLVMIDYVNKARQTGITAAKAVVEAGCKRFRAILLTSLTTFIGLVPIMLETSMQAKMVVPMAISLAYGVLFATVVTLILIPCLYIVFEDIGRAFKRMIAWFKGEDEKSVLATQVLNETKIDDYSPSSKDW